MPCFKPITAWRSTKLNPSGKRGLVFSPSKGYKDLEVKIPCGQCIGCRLERSRQWAIRCVHEASLYENNCFITLTFDNAHLPPNSSLSVRTFQLFMKRLRKKFGADIRFFHCGEYGENFGRPHYHACLFNFDFKDKQLFKINVSGNRLYISESLSQLWPYGFSTIGDVTFESAAYVARYIMKKVTGERADSHYNYVSDVGEIINRLPEYTTMSRRPGIGKKWLEKFSDDVYNGDFVVMNNKKMKPPKFYDRCYEHEYPEDFQDLKISRMSEMRKHLDDNTPERLKSREIVQQSKLNKLLRKEIK